MSLATSTVTRRAALVIEADHEARDVQTTALQRDGFTTVEAADARRGIDLLRSRSVDLVVLRLAPGDGGVELVRRVREVSEVPLIVLAPDADVDTRVVCLRLGADDVLPSPYSVNELAARAEAVLRRGRPAATVETLEFDGLRVLLRSRRTFVGGVEVLLTPKEFDLLTYLATHPGQVFSKDQLLVNVWHSHPDWQQWSTVTEHVRRLRLKIEKDIARPRWIRTVRGVGYRFDHGDESA